MQSADFGMRNSLEDRCLILPTNLSSELSNLLCEL